MKHPMLNVCPNTETLRLRPAEEIPAASGCRVTCRKSCGENFVASVRKTIHEQYWKLDYNDRSTWLAGLISSHKPSRVRISGENRVKERARANTYSLPNNGEDIEVFILFIFIFMPSSEITRFETVPPPFCHQHSITYFFEIFTCRVLHQNIYI